MAFEKKCCDFRAFDGASFVGVAVFSDIEQCLLFCFYMVYSSLRIRAGWFLCVGDICGC